jgi:hypothetical protein
MKISLIGVCGLAFAGLAIIAAADNRAQGAWGDAQVMIEFQRGADAYAFSHRQVERRGEAPPARVEGALFTPRVADAFRKRIWTAMNLQGCELPRGAGNDFVVPRVNTRIDGAPAVPSCIAAVLPPLPTELEYRAAGVALVLADAHLHIGVDVLHAAFPAPDN